MWFNRKSEPVDLETFRDISDDVIESDFVPYACPYDAETLLTKNGQLIQIVKITGLDYDTAIDDAKPLRIALREAIRDAIPTTEYAIWLHTMRRRVRLTPQGTFPDAFSNRVHEMWREVQQWDNAYINEVYLSIVHEHQFITMKNPVLLSKAFLSASMNRERSRYIERASSELKQCVDTLCKRLVSYKPRRLGVIEREGKYFHEGVEFLAKLINLKEMPMPLSMRDLSRELTSGDITFGHNAMEVRGADGQRRFAAILTVKEYKEASLAALDQFLEIPCEIIISQCFDFIHAEKARDAYELQHRYLKTGGDEQMIAMSEVASLVESGRTSVKEFGESQTTMFVIAPSVRELEANLRMVRRAMAKIGIVSVREDLMLEDCYWAQLPANLAFTRRMNPINTNHLGGFISLQSMPMGNAVGSPWGPPVTLFPTVGGTPYFFNFHRGQNGHTTLIGPLGTGKTTLLHFLLAQARKLNARIWYIDTRGKTEIWARAMGAAHHRFAPEGGLSRMSPLTQKDSPEHRDFLAVWLTTLIDPTGAKINRATVQFFRAMVDRIYSLPPEHRSLSLIAQQLAEADMMLASELTRWVGDNPLAALFENKNETFTLDDFTILDISAFMQDEAQRTPVASYLLHRLTSALDKRRPTILVLDEAWHLLASPLFASRVGDWFEHLTSENTIAISTTEDVEGSANYTFASQVTARAATQLYLPNAEAGMEYLSVFGLSEQELIYVQQMRTSERHVLTKRGREVAVLKANLAPLGDLLYPLASTEKPVQEQVLTAEQQLARLMGWESSKGPDSTAA